MTLKALDSFMLRETHVDQQLQVLRVHTSASGKAGDAVITVVKVDHYVTWISRNL